MTLYTFGGSPADVTTNSAGDVLAGVRLTVWTSRALSTQITALTAMDGVTALPGYVESDAEGRVRFKADSQYSAVWLWDGNPASDPWQLAAQEVFGAVGSAIVKADQASTDAAQASADAANAVTTATAAQTRSEAAEAAAADATTVAEAARAAAGSTAPTFADLPTPIIVAHRGGGANVMPDSALETYRATRDRGGVVVEADVYGLADGGTVVMHDSTVDRTTTGSAATGGLSAFGVQKLRIDAGSWFLTGFPSDLRVPTFDDVVEICGPTMALCPEAKNDPAGQAIVDRVVAAGLQQSTMVQSFTLERLDPAIAEGIDTGYLSTTGVGVDWAAVAARGVKWALLGYNTTQDVFDAAKAAGLRLGVWTINRHVDRDKFLSWGVELIFSDDPWYMSGKFIQTTDPYGGRTYGDGMIDIASTGALTYPRGLPNGDGWQYDSYSEGGFYSGALQGWACPIKGDPNADTFTIDFTLAIDLAENTGYWGAVFMGRSDDLPYDDSDATKKPDGYHLLFRSDGRLDFYKVTGGVPSRLGGITTPTAPGAAARAYRIAVTPTQITMSAPNEAAPNSYTAVDAAYRGGYFQFAAGNASATFSDVTIT